MLQELKGSDEKQKEEFTNFLYANGYHDIANSLLKALNSSSIDATRDAQQIHNLEKNNTLDLNYNYKDQWAFLYHDVLKIWDYNNAYEQEMQLLQDSREVFKKYMWALHIAFWPWDLSKEISIYKNLLGINFLDDPKEYKTLDCSHPELEEFRKNHCFIGVDTSMTYNNNLTYLQDLWSGEFWADKGHKYFFDETNSFYINDDIQNFLNTPFIASKSSKFPSVSFEILGNTLLNFSSEQQKNLIDLFMKKLWPQTIGFITLHQKEDKNRLIPPTYEKYLEEHKSIYKDPSLITKNQEEQRKKTYDKHNTCFEWLGIYNTPQERIWLENWIKYQYGVSRFSQQGKVYEFLFSADKEGININIQLLQDAIFTMWDKQVLKKKGAILHLWESQKTTDQEFEQLVQWTKYAKVINEATRKSTNKSVALYVIAHKECKIPVDGFKNYDINFDEKYEGTPDYHQLLNKYMRNSL